MNVDEFREALLSVMDAKRDPAWSAFESGKVRAELLHHHLECEYETYVRDFPVMLGRAYVQCDVASARRALLENAYEEETGGLVAGRPHPELFLMIPRALGMDMARFERVSLPPRAKAYRAHLDECTLRRGWVVAAAVTTIFLEGTAYERGELDESAPKRPVPSLENHPLVKHYGLPLEALALVKAHRTVEGSHRAAAWRIVLEDAPASERGAAAQAIRETLGFWLDYRSEVAELCGVGQRGPG